MNESDHEKFDDELMLLAGELAKDIQPERDLWPNIARAIETPPATSPWNLYFAQAAAVLILIGGSSGLTYLAVSDDHPAPLPVTQARGLDIRTASGSFGSHYQLGPDFQDARSLLESQLDQELQRLSPQARDDVNKNLQAIRTAITVINTALAEEPDNTLLQKLLLSSYREELSVMRKVNGITDSVMFRQDI